MKQLSLLEIMNQQKKLISFLTIKKQNVQQLTRRENQRPILRDGIKKVPHDEYAGGEALYTTGLQSERQTEDLQPRTS
jgi:hypothetical protein